VAGLGPLRQRELYLAGMRGRRPRVPVDAARLEEKARERLSPEAFAYVAGGAGLERTMAANLEAFARRRIVPRVLHDVGARDPSVELFGARLPAPVLLAPIGALDLVRRDADLAVARAAAGEGVPLIFSNQASVPMEACAEAMGDASRWFQLYWSTSDGLVASLVRRAERCGCEAIVLTLDTTLFGWRTRDLDLAYLPFLHGKGLAQYTSDPVFQRMLDEPGHRVPAGRPNIALLQAFLQLARAYPGSFLSNMRSPRPRAAAAVFTRTYSRPSLTWDQLAFLRGVTRLPILLKGVLHAEDGRRAVELGLDGIVVSNHGGRQVDGAIASLDALPAVAEAVGGRVPVLLDSGIRSGADVFKALALGARAVLLGRPYVYGLALAGERGVREVIRNLVADFDLTMGLAGCVSTAEITVENLAPLR
jgi:isopentenyl diphosphate isomerase/L-lactate dehydrogenase-like FMN-dependent dehydrogenase